MLSIVLNIFTLLSAGLKRMRSSVIGWYGLAQAELKMHKYTDSAMSSSQGTTYNLTAPQSLLQHKH